MKIFFTHYVEKSSIKRTLVFSLLFIGNKYSNIDTDYYQYIIYAFKIKEPGLLNNDWFYDNFDDYHILFTQLILLTTKFFDLNIALLIIYLSYLIILTYAIDLLTKTYKMNIIWTTFFTVTILLGNFETSGRYIFLGASSLPAYIALAISLLIVAKMIQGKYDSAVLILILLFYWHLSAGFWMLLIVYSYLYLRFFLVDNNLKTLLKYNSMLFLLLPRIYLAFTNSMTNLSNDTFLDESLLKEILDFRVAHHFAYLSFGYQTNTVNIFLFVMIFIFAWIIRSYFLLHLNLLILIFNIMGYYFYYVRFFYEFTVLFPYRLNAIQVPVFIFLCFCILSRNAFNMKTKFMSFLSLIVFFALNLVNWSKVNFAFDIGFIFLFMWFLLMLIYTWINTKEMNYLIIVMQAILITSLITNQNPMKMFTSKLINDNFKTLSYYLNSNSVVLTYFDIDPSFRVSSRAGLIVDFKSFPIGNKILTLEWYRRVLDLMNLNEKSPEEIYKLATKYNANYILLNNAYKGDFASYCQKKCSVIDQVNSYQLISLSNLSEHSK